MSALTKLYQCHLTISPLLTLPYLLDFSYHLLDLFVISPLRNCITNPATSSSRYHKCSPLISPSMLQSTDTHPSSSEPKSCMPLFTNLLTQINNCSHVHMILQVCTLVCSLLTVNLPIHNFCALCVKH